MSDDRKRLLKELIRQLHAAYHRRKLKKNSNRF